MLIKLRLSLGQIAFLAKTDADWHETVTHPLRDIKGRRWVPWRTGLLKYISNEERIGRIKVKYKTHRGEHRSFHFSFERLGPQPGDSVVVHLDGEHYEGRVRHAEYVFDDTEDFTYRTMEDLLYTVDLRKRHKGQTSVRVRSGHVELTQVFCFRESEES